MPRTINVNADITVANITHPFNGSSITFCREIAFREIIFNLTTMLDNIEGRDARSLVYYSGINMAALRYALLEQWHPVTAVTIQMSTSSIRYADAERVAESFPSVQMTRIEHATGTWLRSRTMPGLQLTGDMFVLPAFFWIMKAARDGIWRESTSSSSLCQRFRQSVTLKDTIPNYPLLMLAGGCGPIDMLRNYTHRGNFPDYFGAGVENARMHLSAIRGT